MGPPLDDARVVGLSAQDHVEAQGKGDSGTSPAGTVGGDEGGGKRGKVGVGMIDKRSSLVFRGTFVCFDSGFAG